MICSRPILSGPANSLFNCDLDFQGKCSKQQFGPIRRDRWESGDTNDTKSSSRDILTIPVRFRFTTVTG
jgi:hypothetical protein